MDNHKEKMKFDVKDKMEKYANYMKVMLEIYNPYKYTLKLIDINKRYKYSLEKEKNIQNLELLILGEAVIYSFIII